MMSVPSPRVIEYSLAESNNNNNEEAQMDHESISTTLPQKVVDDELEIITARRHVAYPSRTQEQSARKDISKDLRGLSISGGGIRSSTFSIGVIQSLARAKLFKDIDYMSTVSGGGYTGSMLSTMLNNEKEKPNNFPLLMPVGTEEPKPLQHLRNGSNYLTPGGFLELVRMPAVVVRGLIINFLILMPFIMAAVILTEVMHEVVPILNIYQSIAHFEPNGMEVGLYAFWLLFGLGSYFLLSGWYAIHKKWPRRNSYELWIARVFLLLIALVLFGPLNAIVDRAMQMPWHTLEGAISDTFHKATWIIGTGLTLIAILVIKASANLSAVAGKLVFVVTAVLGPAIIFGVYLLLVVAQLDSPFITFEKPLNSGGETASKTKFELSLDCNQAEAIKRKDIGINWVGKNNGSACKDQDEKPPAEATVATVATVYCGKDRWLFKSPLSDKVTEKWDNEPARTCDNMDPKYLKSEGLLVLQPRKVWPDPELYLQEARQKGPNLSYEIRGADLFLGGNRGTAALMDDRIFFLLTLLLFLLNYLFINVNQSSLHGFYRDRLSKLYLIDRDLASESKVRHNDDIKLSELNNPGTSVPYHIVNSTLNLQGDTQESQRGRDSDFFFFSKLYCGGSHTGYCDTKAMEDKDAHLNLGTAMAISAAAAAPNMGATTIKSLIFILTLLNLRLGYWIPNPSFVTRDKRISKPWGRFLWREAVGKMTATASLVNVSDGGHLENLALYEMLRRRCKTIVCIDGEADPHHTFNGLVTLIRIARIDLGVEIDINLDELRLKGNMCEKHFAVGKINYADGEEPGTLIYVKSSYIKENEENPFLRKYRADHSSFPHESTADQFFDERQFEAYRALGESVGRDLVKAIADKRVPWPEVLAPAQAST
jgi:hypothetical protein